MYKTPFTSFGDQHHEQFMAEGYLRLGNLLTPNELAALQQRIDDIMLGTVRYENMRFQINPETPADKAVRTLGNQKSTLAYRRIDDLEQDPLFLSYIQHPLIRQIASRYIGENVSVFRAMFMNKPAESGTVLPWHQDIGVGWGIDTNPIITVWMSLDKATVASGCMQIVPSSNNLGILNERHYTSEADQARHVRTKDVVDLETEAGEAVLLHNFLLHRSALNSTATPRRAFSVTYMDAATRSVKTGLTFPLVFGKNAPDPVSVPEKAAELMDVFHG
ncbi:MAG: phytanoyl-CoA dioxygenase family protein [Candidatus Latescibacterota bacterium]|nr:phytanoyl-CoA dioxygenase family protein [Candidatus Latescibacterota bacterium]